MILNEAFNKAVYDWERNEIGFIMKQMRDEHATGLMPREYHLKHLEAVKDTPHLNCTHCYYHYRK